MGIAIGGNAVSLSGSYIPVIYSAKLLIKFYGATVFGQIANTEYEGEIKDKGDSVVISTVPSMIVRDYVKGVDLVYDNPEPDTVTLDISHAKYYGVKINDIDKLQSNVAYAEKWSDDGSLQLKAAIDTSILSSIPADCDADNMGSTAGKQAHDIDLGAAGAPVVVTKANAIDKIVECSQILTEQLYPTTERWMVIPSWYKTRLLLSELKDASLTGDNRSTLRTGRLGVIGDFEIFESQSVKHVFDNSKNCGSIMFGHKSALTFASQLVKNDIVDNLNDFGKVMRGLHVYGYETIKPTGTGVLYATPGTL